MPTRLHAVMVDATDPGRTGRFWAEALSWPVIVEGPDGMLVGVADAAPWGEGGFPRLGFVAVPEPKVGKNRVHLDLATASLADQQETVARLLDLGASRADIGQEEAPWVVMADPEGNELCVLDPREAYQDTGPLAAVVIDCADPIELANFWMRATGWPVIRYSEQFAALRHPRTASTWLELLAVPDRKSRKNRVHLDLVARAGGDFDADVGRLQRLGGRRIDVGQGEASWVVMADPEGNEFCVIPPR